MREAAEGSGNSAEEIFSFSGGLAGAGRGRGQGDFVKRDRGGGPVLPRVFLPQRKLRPRGWRLLGARQPLCSLISLRHQEGNFLP